MAPSSLFSLSKAPSSECLGSPSVLCAWVLSSGRLQNGLLQQTDAGVLLEKGLFQRNRCKKFRCISCSRKAVLFCGSCHVQKGGFLLELGNSWLVPWHFPWVELCFNMFYYISNFIKARLLVEALFQKVWVQATLLRSSRWAVAPPAVASHRRPRPFG